MCTRKVIGALFLCLGMLALSMPMLSQGNLGRIVGGATDQSGGAVAGATVTILDVARGTSRTLATDDAGQYSVPGLIPGQYEVRVEAAGFNKFDRQNVVLQVGQEMRVDAVLTPGSQTQTLTVTEQAPTITTTSATMGGVVDN